MVERAGSDNPEIRELRGRVRDIEQTHHEIQRDLAQLAAGQASQNSQLENVAGWVRDMATKLDESRTRRPNLVPILSVIIAGFALIIMIGGLVAAPVYWRLEDLKQAQTESTLQHFNRAERIAAAEEQIKAQAHAIEHLERRMRFVERLHMGAREPGQWGDSEP